MRLLLCQSPRWSSTKIYSIEILFENGETICKAVETFLETVVPSKITFHHRQFGVFFNFAVKFELSATYSESIFFYSDSLLQGISSEFLFFNS